MCVPLSHPKRIHIHTIKFITKITDVIMVLALNKQFADILLDDNEGQISLFNFKPTSKGIIQRY